MQTQLRQLFFIFVLESFQFRSKKFLLLNLSESFQDEATSGIVRHAYPHNGWCCGIKRTEAQFFLQTTGIVLRQTPLRSLETMQHKRTCDMCVLFLHPRHSNVCERKFAIAIRPHKLQTWTLYGSDASKSRSRRNCAAPCAIWQSRSISPKRSPPSLLNNNNFITCRLCGG